MLMVIFAIVSVPISYLNIVHQIGVLDLLSDEAYLKVFSKEELNTHVMLSLEPYNNGNLAAHVFGGCGYFRSDIWYTSQDSFRGFWGLC